MPAPAHLPAHPDGRGRGLRYRLGAYLLLLTCLASLQVACSQAGLYERLQSTEDPKVRAQAAIEAGDKGDREAIPYLIELLDDQDEVVRMMAALSLRRITGGSMGYRVYDSYPDRQAAIQRWRQWARAGAKGTPTYAPEPESQP